MSQADAQSRRDNKSDNYATPAPCIRALLDEISIHKENTILDPCSGGGIFQRTCKEKGLEISGYDILEGRDFLNEKGHYNLIIANPPYSQKNQFIKKALEVADRIYMILPMAVVNYNQFHREFLNINNYMGRYLMTPKFFMTDIETENPKRGGISAYSWFYWQGNSQEGRRNNESFERYINLEKYFVKD